MKKLLSRISVAFFLALVLLTVSILALPAMSAQAASTPECWAVLAGVSSYQSASVPDLNYCDDDAQELSDVFSPVWGSSHIRLLKDSQATKTAILSAISWLASSADADDTVLFSFSGHGSSAGVFCPYDYSSTSTGISTAELSNALSSVRAGKIVVILDSCYAGKFQSILAYNGRVVMMASRSYETSMESSSLRNGVFTYYVLKALGSFDTADTNHDYELSAEEIALYANPLTTQYESDQHPVLDDNYYGELALLAKFVFALNISLPYGTTLLTLDGRNYTSIPLLMLWVPGISHTITVPQMVDPGAGTRYVFTKWNDGSVTVARAITKGSYTANYDKEHLLKVVSLFGEIKGDGWYKDGSKAVFSVPSYIELSDTKHYFTGWSGGYTGTEATAAIAMIAPATVTAKWRNEYLLTLNSKYGTLTGAGWYREGATAGFSVTPYIELPDTKHYFTGWSGAYTGTSSSASLVMSNPKVVDASWRHEYLLTLKSEYGEPTGSGWYKEGQKAALSVEPVQGIIIRQIFTSWSGDLTDTSADSSVTMNSPKVITANWRTDYIQLYILIGGVIVLVVIIAAVLRVRRHRLVT